MKSYNIYVNDKYIGLICTDKVKPMGGHVLNLYKHHRFWFDNLVCIINNGILNEKDSRIDIDDKVNKELTEHRIEFLDDPKIVDALKRALDRGVKVKIYVGSGDIKDA